MAKVARISRNARRAAIATLIAAVAAGTAVVVVNTGPSPDVEPMFISTPREPKVRAPERRSVSARGPSPRAIRPDAMFGRVGARTGDPSIRAMAAYDRNGVDGLRSAFGDRFIETREVRQPGFMLGCSMYGAYGRYGGWRVILDGQMDMPTPVVHFWRDYADADYACLIIRDSRRPVLVVCMMDELPGDLIDLLGRTDNIAAIVLGHALHADVSTDTFSQHARRLDAERAVVQSLTNAPIYLAVSNTNAHDSDPVRVMDSGRAWVDAQPNIHKWDGFAVYNINGFAWFEFNSLRSARNRLGLPGDKPVMLFELIGTQANDDRSAEIWRRKAVGLMPRIVRDGWAGLILYSNEDDKVKRQAVEHLRRAMP